MTMISSRTNRTQTHLYLVLWKGWGLRFCKETISWVLPLKRIKTKAMWNQLMDQKSTSQCPIHLKTICTRKIKILTKNKLLNKTKNNLLLRKYRVRKITSIWMSKLMTWMLKNFNDSNLCVFEQSNISNSRFFTFNLIILLILIF